MYSCNVQEVQRLRKYGTAEGDVKFVEPVRIGDFLSAMTLNGGGRGGGGGGAGGLR